MIAVRGVKAKSRAARQVLEYIGTAITIMNRMHERIVKFRLPCNILRATIVFISVLSNYTLNAYTGAEHQKMIIECLLGNEYLHDAGAKELVDFVSKGMDFGGGLKPFDFSQLGSSFLNTVREKFPNFKGSHREFGHWSLDGDIPRDVISEFEKVYPGRKDDFVKLWQQYVGTRRGGTRMAMGLTKNADRIAQSLASLQNSCHNLGDWTTPDTKGLPPLRNVVRDIERSYHRILGNNSDVVAEFVGELKSVPDALPVSERAIKMGDIWRQNTKLNKTTIAVLNRYGFDGRIRPIDCAALQREMKLFSNGATIRSIPRINVPHIAAGVDRGAMKAVSRAASRGVAKAGSRGLLSFIGRAVPVIIDVGFWIYGDYKIEEQYTKGLISDVERTERKVENAGSAIGGISGSLGGGYIGGRIAKELGAEGGKEFILIAAVAAVGGLIGDVVGGSSAKAVYEWVNRPPYEVCCDACKIGDVDAMFFNGLYHYEGRYVECNHDIAKAWFRKAACQGDARAQFYYGQCCYSNDTTEAAFWWKMAADSNLMDEKFKESRAASAYNLAGCYMAGMGVDLDGASAIRYLIMAKDLGNINADNDLKKLIVECEEKASRPELDAWALKILGNYHSCLGGAENDTRALKYMLRAANLGNSSAINDLAFAYENGRGIEKNLSKAISLYHLAADMGQPKAINNFMRMVTAHSMWDAYADWLVEKANEGVPEACEQFALMSIASITNASIREMRPFKDLHEHDLDRTAIELLEYAEKSGCNRAKLELARFCEDKEHRQKLSDSSAETYKRRLQELSLCNVVPAQLMLARALRNGLVLQKDEQESSFYYGIAALNGDADAQFEFGLCCLNGRGVPQNRGNAEKWFRLAGKKSAIASLQKTDFIKKIMRETWAMAFKCDSDFGLPVAKQIIFQVPQNAIDEGFSEFSLVMGNSPWFREHERNFQEDRTLRRTSDGATLLVFPMYGKNLQAFSDLQMTLVHKHPLNSYKVTLATANMILDDATIREGEDALSRALHKKYPIRSRLFPEKFIDHVKETFCFHSIETATEKYEWTCTTPDLRARIKKDIKRRFKVDIDF